MVALVSNPIERVSEKELNNGKWSMDDGMRKNGFSSEELFDDEKKIGRKDG